MKQLLFTFIIIVSTTVSGQNLKTYQLDTGKSIINWKGTYSFFFSEHTGTVHFKEGELITSNNNITGGSFVIDMKTISNEEFLKKIGPVEHIRNEDFFYVEKFSEAKLKITSVEYFKNEDSHRIKADLTIKGITKPIQFYPEIDEVNKRMIAKFKIDRTRWGITYNNIIKNDAISEAIEFNAILQF